MSSATNNNERIAPRLLWTRADDGQITICILLGHVEQERFSLNDWDPDSNQGPPLTCWLTDFYKLSEQERRDKHQGRFENYVLARRETERNNPPAEEDEDDGFLEYLAAVRRNEE